MRVLNLLITILILSANNYSYAGSNRGQFSQGKQNSAEQSQELMAEELDGLLYMREEEKLARDVYLTLDSYFDTNIFGNIASAEQKHMDSVKNLINKYGLTDPIENEDDIGSFTVLKFSEFYDNSTSNDVTIEEAIRTGIEIEETDIIDIQEFINETNNTEIRNVYENLLRGSRNHLRAFVRQLESMGIVYKASFIDQTTADAIVDSPTERGSSKNR